MHVLYGAIIQSFSAKNNNVDCLLCSGKGCVYSFDPVGSYERETYRAGGSASALLQPLLDNQVSCLMIYCK